MIDLGVLLDDILSLLINGVELYMQIVDLSFERSDPAEVIFIFDLEILGMLLLALARC